MIHILYEDRFILVCRKLPGILSQAGPGPNLPELLEEAYGGTVYPVHRLDRETGGAMVFARTRPGAAEGILLCDAGRPPAGGGHLAGPAAP